MLFVIKILYNDIDDLNSNFKWVKLMSGTGFTTNQVYSLPTKWNELSCRMHSNDYGNIITVPYEIAATGNASSIINTPYYMAGSDNPYMSKMVIRVTKTHIQFRSYTESGSEKNNTCQYEVWYR